MKYLRFVKRKRKNGICCARARSRRRRRRCCRIFVHQTEICALHNAHRQLQIQFCTAFFRSLAQFSVAIENEALALIVSGVAVYFFERSLHCIVVNKTCETRFAGSVFFSHSLHIQIVNDTLEIGLTKFVSSHGNCCHHQLILTIGCFPYLPKLQTDSIDCDCVKP